MALPENLNLKTYDLNVAEAQSNMIDIFHEVIGKSLDSNMNVLNKVYGDIFEALNKQVEDAEVTNQDIINIKQSIATINQTLEDTSGTGIISIKATFDRTTSNVDYFTATSDDIKEYVDNMVLLVSFEQNNINPTVLNINDFGNLTIKKIDSVGNLIQITGNEIKKNELYIMTLKFSTSELVFVSATGTGSGTGGDANLTSQTFTISVDAWVESTTYGDYPFQADIIADVNENSIVDVMFNVESVFAGNDVGGSTGVDTLSGKIRLYAVEPPEIELHGQYVILVGGTA